MKAETNQTPIFNKQSFFKNGEKIYIHLSTEFPDFVDVMHRHEFIEIVYILSGQATHTVGGRQYNVRCGDVTLINSGVPHKFTPDKNQKERFVAYDLMFMPDFFDASSIKMNNFESLKNSYLFHSLFPDCSLSQPDMYISGKRYSHYGELFTKIYQEFTKKEKAYIELIRAYIIELIILLFRDIEQAGGVDISPEKAETVKMAIKLIEDNYNLNMSVSEIATNVFLGPDYFRKLFKKATGISVSTFQQQIRIDKACKLLKTTNQPIKDICINVGYNDLKSFYEKFKKLVGMTPKEYRENK